MELNRKAFTDFQKRGIMDELIKRIEKMVGYVPLGTTDLLHILKHPDVIDLTKAYLDEGPD